MDFLSIRKKARERARAKEAGTAAPEASARAEEEPAQVGKEGPTDAAGSRARATALPAEPKARFEGLASAADGRFATWRPGSGPPPVEPDPGSYDAAPGSQGASGEPPPSRPVSPAANRTSPPPAAGGRAAAEVPEPPSDPLDLFFYRPDEEAAIVPTLGSAGAEEPVLDPPEQLDEFLTFRLGKEEFAVAIGHVREVLRAPSVTEVPRAPANVLGVVTVRGEVVAVVDARARLGVAGSPRAGAQILIVDAGEGPLGVLVDAVASVVRLPRGAIEACPHGISAASDCVTGIGRRSDQLFMVVDAGALLRRARVTER